jgi:hypothetical protein
VVPAAGNRGEAHRSGCSSLGKPHDLKDRSAPPYDRLRLCRVGTDIMPSGEPRTDAEKPSNRVIPFWIIIVGSALIAGSLAALGGELTYHGLHKEPQYPASFSSLSSSERAVARAVVRFNTRVAVETTKATAAYGLLGVALGVALGLAGGLPGRSRHVSLRGAVIGGVLGGIAGAALSMAFVPLFFQLTADAITALPLLLLTHAAIFAGIGAASGAALGWESGNRWVILKCAVGGVVGALVATLAIEVINVAAFGVMRIFEPVPAKSMARILVNLCVALGTAAGALLAGRRLRARQS